jgi:hypothetical protein
MLDEVSGKLEESPDSSPFRRKVLSNNDNVHTDPSQFTAFSMSKQGIFGKPPLFVSLPSAELALAALARC